MSRKSKIQERIEELITNFPHYLERFVENPPFNRYGQLEYHLATIQARRKLGNVTNAVSNDSFLTSLYQTLKAWGIGVRGSFLIPLNDFCGALRAKAPAIAVFEGLSIDDPKLDVNVITEPLWDIIDNLGIVKNDARIVPGSKTLHHLLPDLVVPIDRAYTQKFFGWHNPQFQYGYADVFDHSFRAFVEIARRTNPAQYVDAGWNSSRTKVIDNAIVGMLSASSTRPCSTARPTVVAR
jgi:hypothetical protein